MQTVASDDPVTWIAHMGILKVKVRVTSVTPRLYMQFLCIHGATIQVEKKKTGNLGNRLYFTFANFGKIKKILRKTKSLGIIYTSWATFVPNSAFSLFLVSEVAWRIICSFWPQLKNFF